MTRRDPLPPLPTRTDGTALRALVVDDEVSLADLLASVMRLDGWDVRTAGDGTAAVREARDFRPDVAVLDVMLPDLDGLEVMRRIHAEDPEVRVLFLTARDAVEDRVTGITAGGDDYLTKPFNLEELLARLRALVRRSAVPLFAIGSVLQVADLTLDEETYDVRRGGELIALTATEFELLRYLMRNARRVLGKDQILDAVWKYDFGGQAHVVEIYISYLRRKIDAGRRPLIHTVRGVGVRPAATDMTRTLLSPRRRTLRVRLTVGTVALLTAAGVTIGLVTVLGLHRFLVSQVDLQLEASQARVVDALYGLDRDDHEGRPSSPGEVPGLTAGTLIVHLTGDTAQAYVIAEGPTQLGPQDLGVLQQIPTDAEPTTAELSDGDYRALAASIGTKGDVLVVALPLSGVNRTTAQVLALEGIVFALVISVAGVVAALFVGSSLEPLRRVAGTATRVADLPLGTGEVDVRERVPDADPGTEVGQVAAALNVLLDHMEASFAQRHATEERLRQFVADASHELRTPVSVISGYTQLAQRDADELPPATVKSLDRIEAETARMSTLVDDLLLLARLDSGRPLARDQVDLSRLTIDVGDDARAAGQQHHWQLDVPEESLVVVGDEQRLHQALANLTANARAHTPPGTTVSVALRAEGPDWVSVDVVDDGPGIPAELQSTLFERFVRGETSRSRATGGTGLGLAIVAAVVTAHGGHIAVTSAPGDTRFTIRLPVDGPVASKNAADSAAMRSA